MKHVDLEWRRLRTPVLLLLAVTIAASIWVYLSAAWMLETRYLLDQELSKLNQIRTRSAQADQEKALILRYRDAYEDLISRGVVGPEQRVNWLDALRAANQQVRSLGVDYQLNPQSSSTLRLDSGNYRILQTNMKIQIRLLHEEDLLRYLDSLYEQRAGLLLIQNCSMQRSNNNAFAIRLDTRLVAECELAWLSLSLDTASRTSPP